MNEYLSSTSYRLDEIAEEIDTLIKRQGKVSYTFSWGEEEYYPTYSSQTLKMLKTLKKDFHIMSEKCRILFKFTGGDTGENDFVEQINAITKTKKTRKEKA